MGASAPWHKHQGGGRRALVGRCARSAGGSQEPADLPVATELRGARDQGKRAFVRARVCTCFLLAPPRIGRAAQILKDSKSNKFPDGAPPPCRALSKPALAHRPFVSASLLIIAPGSLRRFCGRLLCFPVSGPTLCVEIRPGRIRSNIWAEMRRRIFGPKLGPDSTKASTGFRSRSDPWGRRRPRGHGDALPHGNLLLGRRQRFHG